MAERRNGVRIANVYGRAFSGQFKPYHMAQTRWLRMSEALARLGYYVDMVVNATRPTEQWGPRLRLVGTDQVHWDDYDVIKTNYQAGFLTLVEAGAQDHPFIIGRLGTVVAGVDRDDISFRGAERDLLWQVQQQIERHCRYVSLLTVPERRVWQAEHRSSTPTLLVPAGADATIPPPQINPYTGFAEKIAVYIGNLRGDSKPYRFGGREALGGVTQQHTNARWQSRLNYLGRLLRGGGIRLCFVGTGRTDELDNRYVTNLGPVENARIWDYHHFAHAAIALAHAETQHNECSKIYYYLRGGLPVISEEPIPNNVVIQEANLGMIAPYGNDEAMASMVHEAVTRHWDRAGAQRYMRRSHSWNARARIYDRLIRKELAR